MRDFTFQLHTGVQDLSFLQAAWLSLETRCGHVMCPPTLNQSKKAVREVTQHMIQAPAWPRAIGTAGPGTARTTGQTFRVHLGALVRKGVDTSFMSTWSSDLHTRNLDEWVLDDVVHQAQCAGFKTLIDSGRIADALQAEDADMEDFEFSSYEYNEYRQHWWEQQARSTFDTILIYTKDRVVQLVCADREAQLALYALCRSPAAARQHVRTAPDDATSRPAGPTAETADAVLVYRVESAEVMIVEGFVR